MQPQTRFNYIFVFEAQFARIEMRIIIEDHTWADEGNTNTNVLTIDH